jgi:ethanolamine-phosphate cytidylyltransferase
MSLSIDYFGLADLHTWIPLIAGLLYLVHHLYAQRIRHLTNELNQARTLLRYLQDSQDQEPPQRPIRIFMDGAFDVLHFGHMNAFRLGRALGTHLIVGVNSDASITQCKGAPLMNDSERLTSVRACKFVDDVVPGCPYIMNADYLNYVIDKYKIDYVVHGEDPCIVNGVDVYAAAKEAGKYKTIPRTEGVSTTDIVGRMLLLTKEHHLPSGADSAKSTLTTGMIADSHFLTTSRMLQLFSASMRAPAAGMKIVYIDGVWDLFHAGHIVTLKAARAVSTECS